MLDKVRSLLGHRVAPPRFLLFAAALAVCWTVAVLSLADPRIALLGGFDVAAAVFLLTCLPLLNDDAAQMRRTARKNDANRVALLAITVLVTIVILFAVGTLMANRQELGWRGVALVVGTLALTWLFANTVFTLHYAHLYYQRSSGGDRGGLDMPHTREPDYWDFLYFSFTLGMTFQTSDVTIGGAHMRKVVLGQTMAAFLFNMGIVAFTVNALGGI